MNDWSELSKVGRKVFQFENLSDFFIKKMKYVPDDLILFMKGKKYLMPRAYSTMYKNIRNTSISTYGSIESLMEIFSKKEKMKFDSIQYISIENQILSEPYRCMSRDIK